MKNNFELQKDVQQAIQWEKSLHNADIRIYAENGIITLTGTVDSFLKKSKAEDAVKKVGGVVGIVEKIEVAYMNDFTKSDNTIAIAAVAALKSGRDVPNVAIQVKVEDGWVTLSGNVQWNYQKEAAKKAVGLVDGVKVLTNDIRVTAETTDEIEKKDIENALKRSWSMDGLDVQVRVAGNAVILNGTVDSFYQKDEAVRMAWNAPGVCKVNNELVIAYTT
jgi:osmotically-inducible protein OsmY